MVLAQAERVLFIRVATVNAAKRRSIDAESQKIGFLTGFSVTFGGPAPTSRDLPIDVAASWVRATTRTAE